MNIMLQVDGDGTVTRFWTYIGSSYGERGLKSRVGDHLSPSYRLRNSCYHYDVMAKKGVQSFFMSLLRFPGRDVVPFSSVILAETVCAMLFGGYATIPFRTQRAALIPDALPDASSANRSNPLLSDDGSGLNPTSLACVPSRRKPGMLCVWDERA